MSWRDYRTAPPAATPICRAADVERVGAFTIVTTAGTFPVLVLLGAQGWQAYVNACPHQYLPLDYRSDHILSADGTKLLCTAHGASFAAETGDPISGAECGLDAIPVELVDGWIRIAANG